MKSASLLLAAAMVVACGRSRDTSPDAGNTVPAAAPLVGVWRVVRFCDDDSTGRLYEPFGPSPLGYFVYAADGHLSIQVMRGPGSGAGDGLETYFGYFGTYTITSDSTVVHHVEGGTDSTYVGVEQDRVYRLRGDSLTIGASRRAWPCRLLVRAASSRPGNGVRLH